MSEQEETNEYAQYIDWRNIYINPTKIKIGNIYTEVDMADAFVNGYKASAERKDEENKHFLEEIDSLEREISDWESTCIKQSEEIEQQAAEIKALRNFAKASYPLLNESDYFIVLLLNNRLIDETGNPTKLLTGESE